MKRKLLFTRYAIAIFLLGMAFSCKKEFKDVDQVVDLQLTHDPNFVTFSTAAEAAKEAEYSRIVSGTLATQVNSGRPAKGSTARHLISINATNATEKKITDSVALPTASNPSMYIFNYSGGGFVIIAADKRVQPIMAYSKSGSFKYADNLPPGLVNWLNMNDKNMKSLRNAPSFKPRVSAKALWDEVAKPVSKIGGLTTFNHPLPPPCETGDSLVAMVAPLLTTQWGQGYPYNILCPYDIGYSTPDPTGCVATALGQVMRYWQYPTTYRTNTYSWTGMPLIYNDPYATGAGLGSVARLMYDLGLHGNLYMSYSHSASAAYTADITGTLTNMGYSSAAYDGSYGGGDYFTVMQNLDYGWPVILGGNNGGSFAHAWVCDGYIETNFTDCEAQTSEDLLVFDMNWGWDGFCNGWYGFNYWQVYYYGTSNPPVYINTGLTMNYNIHP